IEAINGQEKLKKECIIDVGGGCGYFADQLNKKTGRPVRVIDSDTHSINEVAKLNNKKIFGVVGDALKPDIQGDESIVCFNLILHHIIGGNEEETRALQKKQFPCGKIKLNTYLSMNMYMTHGSATLVAA
ncbi:MAG: class I SAM-dependent methyltransferase, partial [Gammaproteobacteria bacterium]|nr:class I SAM-dependent methyltransferase [Gammaproteobacteria bacterium]